MAIRDIINQKNKEAQTIRDRIKIKIAELNSADDRSAIEKLAEEMEILKASAIKLLDQLKVIPDATEVVRLYATVAPRVEKILAYKESVKIAIEQDKVKKNEIAEHSCKLKEMATSLCKKYIAAKNYPEIKVEIQQYTKLLESIPGALANKMQSCLETATLKAQPETYCNLLFECGDMSENDLLTPISKELAESIELVFCN